MRDLFVRVGTAVAVLPIFLFFYFYSYMSFAFLLLIGLVFIAIFEWPLFCRNNKNLWYLFPFYPSTPIFCLMFLRYKYSSIDILFPLYPFLVAWVADSGGYLVGKAIGRRKICPSISPKKSWEGLLGSVLFVFILNLILVNRMPGFLFFRLTKSLPGILFYSIVFSVFALVGDLFESFFKRSASIKDSGSIFPGHGGVLDRVDSTLFTGVLLLALTLFL